MTTIPHSQRYLPHDVLTKYYACKLYRSGHSVRFVCRRYKISKASLMRWNKKFDGNKDSLRNKPHTPLSPHPNAHTPLEIKSIRDYMRRNSPISLPELYGKLRIHKAYRCHPVSYIAVCVNLVILNQPLRSLPNIFLSLTILLLVSV